MPTVPKFDPARGARGRGPVQLPAEGRKGPPPDWPLPVKPTPEERKAWRELWATPQAVAWERLGWTRTIGRYCVQMVRAEAVGASPALLAAVTAMEDRLGLTPKSMRLLLWEIVTVEVGDDQAAASASDIRKRIKAV